MSQASEPPSTGPNALGPCGAAVVLVAGLTLAAWAIGLPEAELLLATDHRRAERPVA